MRKKIISDKHKKFADIYMNNGSNAIEAYMEVFGCARSTAKVQGYKVKNRPEVQEYIESQERKLNEKIVSKRILTKEQVLEELSEIALNPKCSWMQRVQALKYIGDYHGLFVQRIEQENANIEVIVEGIDAEFREID